MARPDLYLADLFAGGGGFSTGVAQACAELGKHPDLVAVNHWKTAVETHKRNHPWARHYCTGLDALNPTEAAPNGRLNLLTASPECTHFANARGAKPMNDQSRASAWLILKWLQEVYVDSVLIENVQEFINWGPLGADSRPLKSMRGSLFTQFISSLKALGYNVEYQVRNSANFGAHTARERLLIMGRRGKNKRIIWPDETHAPDADVQFDMFSHKAKWKAAREIIDWSRPSQSIFNRKRPLAPSTLERIAAGLRKFGGKHADPFLVVLRNHMDARSVEEPVPTLAANGLHVGLCEPKPFVLSMEHKGSAHRVFDLENPMPTITTADAWGVVQPFLAEFHGSHAGRNDAAQRVKSVDQPLPVQTTENRFGVVQPFYFNMQRAQDPFLSVDKPMPTITASSSDYGLVEPFIISYYGTQNMSAVDQPLPTCTSKARFALVQVQPGVYLDIHFRMLHWSELAAAMGFPPGYEFMGTQEEKVRMIGNAVEVKFAKAHALSALAA